MLTSVVNAIAHWKNKPKEHLENSTVRTVANLSVDLYQVKAGQCLNQLLSVYNLMFLCQHLGVAPEEGVYLRDKMSDPTYKPPPCFRLVLRLQNQGVYIWDATVYIYVYIYYWSVMLTHRYYTQEGRLPQKWNQGQPEQYLFFMMLWQQLSLLSFETWQIDCTIPALSWCIKDWMNTKNRFHISLERKMIWVFDVISNHFSTGHTHCPTQSHAHILYFHLSLPCVPKFSEGVADLQKEWTCKCYTDEQIQHMLLWMVGRRIGSAVIQSRKTKIICARVYFWRQFSPFLGNSCADDHPPTEKPVEGNDSVAIGVAALKLPVDLWQWKFISLHQWTPLHVAAYRDDVDAVTFLVDKGADVNIKDEYEVSEWGAADSMLMLLFWFGVVNFSDCWPGTKMQAVYT